MDNIKTLILDMGGVIHSVDGTSPLFDIAKYYDVTPELISDDYHRFIEKIRIGSEVEPMFKFFSNEFRRPIPKNIPDIMSKGIKSAKLNHELIKYLSDLRNQGIRLLVLSNSITFHSSWIRNVGWYDYFDHVYLSQEIVLAKPDERAFTYVIDKERLNPSQSVFIDDLQVNIEVAKELGLKTILAITEQQIIKNLQDLLHA